MKYDCTKTLDYSHEKKRMCGTYHNCSDGCPLRELYCQGDITQGKIAIVQKWSDEHPEKTRKEAFFEMFPKNKISMGTLCFAKLIGLDGCATVDAEILPCEKCWQKPYNGEFEKAREEE